MPVRIDKVILRGDRVAYADRFLDDTGQFDRFDRGPEAPTHWGFNARGTVLERGPRASLCKVQWDDGAVKMVLAQNLKRVDVED